MSAGDILTELRRLNPGVRYAATIDGSAVGEWVEARGRFVPLYAAMIDGRWCRMFSPGGSITEILADGLPVPREWVE